MSLNSTLIFLVIMICIKSSIVHTDGIRIAAFNLQEFGQTKVSKPEVVNVLVEIIKRYDIILIQEIRDVAETAIVELLQEVNNASEYEYNMSVSERLGRTSSKEQYAFIYRTESVKVRNTSQYADPDDVFEREPYSVLFHSDGSAVREFALMACHVKPTEAVAEINNLTVVHQELEDLWNNDNILIMGDLNADCNYVSASELPTLLTKTDDKFYWWITDEDDTSLADSICAYDRFIMTGSDFIANVANNSARTFYYDQEYGLNKTFALEVSDHYPIEITIASSGDSDTESTPSSNIEADITTTSIQSNTSIVVVNFYCKIVALLLTLNHVFASS